jgi:thioredoxin-dependent peroxiredoxin
VFGVSRDTVGKHRRFRERYDLPFPLIADVDRSIAAAYGVLTEKSMFGKKYVGTARVTFVIDAAGRIVHVCDSSNPLVHAAEAAEALGARPGQTSR